MTQLATKQTDLNVTLFDAEATIRYWTPATEREGILLDHLKEVQGKLEVLDLEASEEREDLRSELKEAKDEKLATEEKLSILQREADDLRALVHKFTTASEVLGLIVEEAQEL